MQPDVDDDEWNDDERENSVPFDSIRPSTPILNQSSRKTNALRRRQTIGAVQGRQYRTPLRHIQAMLWPRRATQTITVDMNSSNEREEIPMIDDKTT
ncbi:unnamed protein product [Adineta ricciae]|uniref:Uncharacterized protein n=1 Tax=Adineta ricciae TaxID=249248 RepID=A0A815HK47_ADIRI|nr:unnamed protein product [Adineta ricciae]